MLVNIVSRLKSVRPVFHLWQDSGLSVIFFFFWFFISYLLFSLSELHLNDCRLLEKCSDKEQSLQQLVSAVKTLSSLHTLSLAQNRLGEFTRGWYHNTFYFTLKKCYKNVLSIYIIFSSDIVACSHSKNGVCLGQALFWTFTQFCEAVGPQVRRSINFNSVLVLCSFITYGSNKH